MSIQFDRLIKLSPYPVEERSLLMATGGFLWKFEDDTGAYQHKDFTPSIIINADVGCKAKKWALIHELGHAIHYRRRCKCFRNWRTTEDDYLCELHAERFALRFTLRYKLKGVLQYVMEDCKNNLWRYGPVYWRVYSQLRSERIWQRCKEYLGE